MIDIAQDQNMLNVQTTLFSPADSTAYYYGGLIVPIAAATAARMYFTRAVKITQCEVLTVVAGTLGSGETFTFAIRKNNTTDTTVTSSMQLDTLSERWSNTALDIDFADGDYMELKLTTPAWATNPTLVYMTATIRFYVT